MNLQRPRKLSRRRNWWIICAWILYLFLLQLVGEDSGILGARNDLYIIYEILLALCGLDDDTLMIIKYIERGRTLHLQALGLFIVIVGARAFRPADDVRNGRRLLYNERTILTKQIQFLLALHFFSFDEGFLFQVTLLHDTLQQLESPWTDFGSERRPVPHLVLLLAWIRQLQVAEVSIELLGRDVLRGAVQCLIHLAALLSGRRHGLGIVPDTLYHVTMARLFQVKYLRVGLNGRIVHFRLPLCV